VIVLTDFMVDGISVISSKSGLTSVISSFLAVPGGVGQRTQLGDADRAAVRVEDAWAGGEEDGRGLQGPNEDLLDLRGGQLGGGGGGDGHEGLQT
jgi:hypothetical protein